MSKDSNYPPKVTVYDLITFTLTEGGTAYRTRYCNTWYHIQIQDAVNNHRYTAYQFGKPWVVSRGDTLEIIARDLKARHDKSSFNKAEDKRVKSLLAKHGKEAQGADDTETQGADDTEPKATPKAKPRVVVTIEFDDDDELAHSMTDVLDFIEQANDVGVTSAEIRFPEPVKSVKLW